MKSDIEFTCLLFKDNIRAFIDDELPINQKSNFLAHASHCTMCKKELHTMQKIKQELANFKPLTVSNEFDFRLKSRISRENALLRNPFYSFKLTLQDNAGKFLLMPAFIVVFLFSSMFYNNDTRRSLPGLPIEVLSQIDAREGVDLISVPYNARIEEVNYVLEKVKSTDADKGIFLINPDGTVKSSETDNSITLISF